MFKRWSENEKNRRSLKLKKKDFIHQVCIEVLIAKRKMTTISVVD
jgi:hypothetical protein